MDYLRRLHPRLAGRAEAAVPDLSAWRAAVLTLGGDAAIDTPSRASMYPPFAADHAAPPANSGAVHGLRPATDELRGHGVDLPLRSNGREDRVTSEADPAAQFAATPRAGPIAAPAAPRDAGSSAHSPRWMPAPQRSPDVAPAPASPTLPLATGRQAPPPIRHGHPRPRAAVDESRATAPPVVHVSIDRIDVRIPPAPAAAAPRRTSAVSNVGTLADYLRGDSRRRP